MNRTSKLFMFLVMLSLLLGGFVFEPVPAKAINNFSVEVTPKLTGAEMRVKRSG